jgi:SAM-dependent methyltransferase
VKKCLAEAEENGLWIPNTHIPDCNMQRESALFKKGITQFRQLFTERHLLALGLLHQTIVELHSPYQEWLLFAFSSTLRYTNRMVTRNPVWRGNRPLEWAKPGFWLPPVQLEANVSIEFLRRCDAVVRGKKDYFKRCQEKTPQEKSSAIEVLESSSPAYYVGTQSSTHMPLPDESVDVIITDPPYGSYVQYADLCNFWSIWLPEIPNLGQLIDTSEEAVIARKRFPGAKNAANYQSILEAVFIECARVLKPNGRLVMTFHNREPRAWAALLLSMAKAGFEIPEGGIIYQDGIPSYKHTAQSRRSGSVIGDFILTFSKSTAAYSAIRDQSVIEELSGTKIIELVEAILHEHGPLRPDMLLAKFYLRLQPFISANISTAIKMGNGAAQKLIDTFDGFELFDSHRRPLLEQHFDYIDEQWSIKEGKQ